ncbi:helicase-exonuclease AddAB subunit AddB [Paenibacillus xylaniclasticus]|uniref:helicase-exonuclease AddAB subunit AddB n=1 Tax=Paenibacillus xylaniclasticus TaxID=588083 RepID=UPI000FD87207|nr:MULTISPECIES: helicase-exonuclease AddAB subunit AddB [Paenibacillus]GFN30327.1 ATP-dependent helicase/deoxyribonuclease subunit B [Paenibacillus curdlanolyticus]
MALRFVLGRSGAGKTRYCLDEIRVKLQAEPDGPPLIMLVPEQATFQTEYELLRGGRSGTIRAQALSFRRLAFRVMQETGGTALVPIDENGKNMLLYKLMHRHGSELQLFQGAGGQPGFIERLGELLTEWKRYGVDSSRLSESMAHQPSGAAASPLLQRKLHDLQLLYRHLELETAHLYADAEDYLTFLARGYALSPSLKGAEIYIDGFHGFTPKEYEALEAIIGSAANVTVALTLDRPYDEGERPHELELFHPTAETYIRLYELAQHNGIAIKETLMLNEGTPPRFMNRTVLAHIEQNYASRRPMAADAMKASLFDSHQQAGELSVHAAPNRRAEAEAAVRDMVRRAREEGMRWREMAIMVRNATDYTDYLTELMQDNGIPYFLDQKRTASYHPLVEFIRSALETVLHGWKYDAVFRCMKTELLFPDEEDSGSRLTRESFDLLENYALAAGIDGWRWLDKRSWKPLVRESLDNPEAAEASSSELERFEVVLEARQAIVLPLQRFSKALESAKDVRSMCEALYQLLEHCGAADRLERWSRADAEAGRVRQSRSHRQLWDSVLSLLDQMVEMTGEEPLTPELFAGMLETGLDSLKLASVPPSLDQVLIGSVDRTRSGDVKVCYILGANDGVLPARMTEDGILTEQERDMLSDAGLPLAPSVRRRLLDERFMIYNAIAAPSRHLWISYAMADEEGKSLHPSELIRHLRTMFPLLPVRMISTEPSEDMTREEQLAFAVRPVSALPHLIARLRAWRQGAEIDDAWWDVFSWFAVRPMWQEPLRRRVASLDYRNVEPPLDADTARKLYGERLRASVSRMERFVSCPFQHFAVYGLRLQERQIYRLEAPDVGQLFHAALSKVADKFGRRWGAVTDQQAADAVAEAVSELAPRLQSEILLSSGRHRYMLTKLKAIIAQAAIMLGDHARRASFHPVGLEVDFGPDGTLPSLVVKTPEGDDIELVGRIDRVDAAETDEGLLLRVMDYKSSSTNLRMEEVAFGLSLQMLAYLDVLLTHGASWLGREVKPAGVLYFHVHNPLLNTAGGLDRHEARRQRLKKFKTKGLLVADEKVIRLMDSELESGYSEVLPVAVKKDGSFYSNSSVLPEDRWEHLRSAVRRTIGAIGGAIGCGAVSISPYRLGGKSPCTFCSYKAVCQFDPLFEGNEYVKLPKLGKDDVWQMLAPAAAEVDSYVREAAASAEAFMTRGNSNDGLNV